MDLDALLTCVGSPGCLVNQAATGLIIGALIFLVASGLSLIFGVLGVVNFAHGAFYMLGAYFALTIFQLTDSFILAVVGAALGVAVFGVIMERLFIARVYRSNVLMQLLVCYALILILDDGVKLIWGAEYQMLGMPPAFQLPPLQVGGGFIPPYYAFLVGASVAVGLVLWFIVARTRFGKTVRAAAANPSMVSALGINTTLLFSLVFGLGSLLAGLAGALAAPIRSLTPGMGLSILIESFIVTVIGGMGSIGGAFVGALLVGLTRAYGSIGFPLFVDGIMFLIMALVLLIKPSGLFGREAR